MKNWGAIHRQRRRNAEPQRRPQSGGLIENCVAIDCGGDGFHIEGGDVTIRGSSSMRNGGAGLHVGNRARVDSSRSTYRENAGADVDNHGRFDSTDDRIG